MGLVDGLQNSGGCGGTIDRHRPFAEGCDRIAKRFADRDGEHERRFPHRFAAKHHTILPRTIQERDVEDFGQLAPGRNLVGRSAPGSKLSTGSLFPRWDKDYEAGFKYLRSNIIGYDELFKDGGVVDLFTKETQGAKKDSLVAYLFRAGLLGIPIRDTQSRTGWIQGFCIPRQTEMVCPTWFSYAMLHPAFSAWFVTNVPRDAAAVLYNKQVVVCPGAVCHEVMPDGMLRLLFRPSSNSGVVACTSRTSSGWQESFSCVDSVGSALICILAVAHRLHGGGHRGIEHLRDVTVRMAQRGYIPQRLGKKAIGESRSRKSAEEWIKQLCSGEADAESHSLITAKEILSLSGLTTDPSDDDSKWRFCLCARLQVSRDRSNQKRF